MDSMEIDAMVECYTDTEMEQFGHDVSDIRRRRADFDRPGMGPSETARIRTWKVHSECDIKDPLHVTLPIKADSSLIDIIELRQLWIVNCNLQST